MPGFLVVRSERAEQRVAARREVERQRVALARRQRQPAEHVRAPAHREVVVVLADVGGDEVDPARGQDAVGRADGPLLAVDEVDARARRVDGAGRGRRRRASRPGDGVGVGVASGSGPGPARRGSSATSSGESCLPASACPAPSAWPCSSSSAWPSPPSCTASWRLVRDLVALLERRPGARGGVAAERREREQDREPAHLNSRRPVRPSPRTSVSIVGPPITASASPSNHSSITAL